MKRKVKLGRVICIFESFEDWDKNVTSRLSKSNTSDRRRLFLSMDGYVMTEDYDFREAEKCNAYPVIAYEVLIVNR